MDKISDGGTVRHISVFKFRGDYLEREALALKLGRCWIFIHVNINLYFVG